MIPLPEEVGEEVLLTSILSGKVVDITGQPVQIEIQANLNKSNTVYKNHLFLNNLNLSSESDVDGQWSFELPDSINMTNGTYYRFDLNGKVFRKILSDYPVEQTLNELTNY